MKLIHYKLFKIILLFILFNCCLKSYAINFQQNSSLNEEIRDIEGLEKKYNFYVRAPIYGNNYAQNTKDWIPYFEDLKKKNSKNEGLIYIDFILTHLYKISDKIDKAIEIGSEAYYNNVNKNVDNKLLCKLLEELEDCYYLTDNSLQLININKEKFKVCGKNEVLFHRLYFKMGLYDMALKAYKKYIKFNTKNYQKYNLYDQGFHLNDFGVFLMYDNKIDSARYYFDEAIKIFNKKNQEDSIFRKDDTEFMIGVVKGNIGTCFLKQGKFEKAIPLYLKEIKASNLYYKGVNWLGSEMVYYRIALCFINTNQFKRADIYINKLKNFKNKYYKLKTEYYSSLNNKDSTLYFSEKYILLSDSIFKEDLKRQKLESLNLSEFNAELRLQQNQIDLLKEQDSNKDLLVKLISIALGIILLFCLVLLYQNLEKNKKQKLIITQKNEIETALTNNRTLLKELNHRVKNNLQMVSSVISLQDSKIKDNESKNHFNSAINRIKVLSKIHNSLYAKNQLNQIDLLNYIIILKNYLVNSIINPEIKVDFKIDIPADLYLNNDKKTTIGLIINELITNSLKYAFTKKNENFITIAIFKKDEYYHFSYSDNGQGFVYEEIDKSKSIGLNLILRLVNQLGEEAIITSDVGMNISFKFKK